MKTNLLTMPWTRWLLMKWLEVPLKLVGSVLTLDGAEINALQMRSEADVDELEIVEAMEREVAGVNESLVPSGGSDGDLVIDVDIERDVAEMNK